MYTFQNHAFRNAKLLIGAVGCGVGGAEFAVWAMLVPDCIVLFIALQRNSVVQEFEEHIWSLIVDLCRNDRGVG
jgi:hypothetical protein